MWRESLCERNFRVGGGVYSGRLRREQGKGEGEGSEMRSGGTTLPKVGLGGREVMNRMDEDGFRGGFPSEEFLYRGSI
jgi:hypothetical protein